MKIILSEFEHEIGQNIEITLLSDIISDLALENADIKNIISQVYPDKRHIIIKDSKNGKPNPTSVTFSYFFVSTFYSCYALKFYEKYKIGEDNYFISKAFVITYIRISIFYNLSYNMLSIIYYEYM